MSDPNLTFSYSAHPFGQDFGIVCRAKRRDGHGGVATTSYFVSAAKAREETFSAALLFICAELEVRLTHVLTERRL